jgi:uncharacterized protein YukE
MDDTFRELQIFRNALENFNRKLKESMNELEDKHNNVSPHWQDEMRKAYDSVWEPLYETMENYINREAPAYEHFLDEKIKAVGRYLRG